MEEKKDRIFSSLGFRFLLGSLIIYGVQLLTVQLVGRFKPEWLYNPTSNLIVAVLPMYLIGMPALIALVSRLPAQKPAVHKMKKSHFVLSLIMCLALMYGSNLLGTLLTYVIGIVKGGAVNNAIANVATSANMGVTFVYMVICAPIMEEFVFRKLIVDRTMRYGQGTAIVLSGLMFGLFHGNLNQFVYAAALGMLLAFLYVKTGNLKITILIHMIINFIGSVVSVLLLKAIHYDEYMFLLELGAGPDVLLRFYGRYLAAYIAYFTYAFIIFGMMITGLILLIVFRKRFVLEKGEESIPKGQRFRVIFCNPGMLTYCLFWGAVIVWQLFWG